MEAEVKPNKIQQLDEYLANQRTDWTRKIRDVADELNLSMENSLSRAYQLDSSLPMNEMHIMNSEISLGKKIRAVLIRIFLAPILKVQI